MRTTMKIASFACLCVIVFALPAGAQEVSAYVGFGGLRDTANPSLPGAPKLGGVIADTGVNVFFGDKWGVGGDISRRLTQGNYAGIQYGISFLGVDAIYRPFRTRSKRAEAEYRVGIGAVRVHYSDDDPDACAQVPGCPVSSHFQVHFSVAERFFVSDHVFIRPAFDLHYVNHFSDFGGNWVPRYSVGLGYAFGR
jgi:hypothetical protein